jgi:mono/diheme cytochrome c family protein
MEPTVEPTVEPSVTPRQKRSRKYLALVIVGCVAAVFLLIQFVPYRVDNPSARHEPAWNSAQTRQLAVAACYDCHSNETNTYWWEDVAPLSWWITNHVKDGRAALNFSECTQGRGENDAVETVRNGSMPPNYYTWFGLHSNATLTSAEKQQLADGLQATLQGWNCGNGGG